MNIKIAPILPEERPAFVQLFNLYEYDFTEFTDNYISDDGYYEYTKSFAENLWADSKMHPFFIRVDGKLAGFVIVADGGYQYLEDKGAHNIDEFFVMKKYRRNGVGSFAAKAAFDMFKGTWEVCQMTNNTPARKFWKSVISEYAGNGYRECGTENDSMVGFIFTKAL